MTVGVNNFFKEFFCGRMHRNRAIGGGRCVLSCFSKIKEIVAPLYGVINEPAEKEK